MRCIIYTGENGCVTIINNRGIIDGKIIHIDGEVTVDIVIFLCIVIVRSTVTVGNIELYAVIAITPHSTGILTEVT